MVPRGGGGGAAAGLDSPSPPRRATLTCHVRAPGRGGYSEGRKVSPRLSAEMETEHILDDSLDSVEVRWPCWCGRGAGDLRRR